MRTTRLASLVLLGALVSAPWSPASDREHPNGKGPTVSESGPRKSLIWEIRGWGQSREDAELDALKKARTEIVDYLREQGVVLEHGPTERDVRPLVKEWSEDESREVQGIGELRQAKL